MFLYLVRIADIALFVHMQRLRQVFQQRCMLPEIFFLREFNTSYYPKTS